MKTLLLLVDQSVAYLQQRGYINARRDALELISSQLAMRPLDLYMQHDRPLSDREIDAIEEAIQRRGAGEPVQYINGYVDFYHCHIAVNKSVLIPRQESELLVEIAIKELTRRPHANKVLWDLCCGSGCLGIAIKKALPELKVTLADISKEALALAKINAENNSVEVDFCCGDLFAPFKGERADYLICNPPYISETEFERLDREVRDFEPKGALVAAEKGLAFYRRLAELLPIFTNRPSKAWLEIGSSQGEAVKQIFKKCDGGETALFNDYAGHQRFFTIELK